MDGKRRGRERGIGSEKVRNLGLELGMPKVQRRYMLARCPRGYQHRQPFAFLTYNGYTLFCSVFAVSFTGSLIKSVDDPSCNMQTFVQSNVLNNENILTHNTAFN